MKIAPSVILEISFDKFVFNFRIWNALNTTNVAH